MEEIRYSIEYDTSVEEKLKSFSKSVREIIKKSIDKKLTKNPIEFGKPLKYKLSGYMSLRVSDYRIIYKIIDEKVMVFIVDIDHRKNVYD